MDIIDKAKELGKMIVESEEFVAMKATEEALEKDEKSIQLMTEYQTLQNELMAALQAGQTGDDVNDIRDRFMAKQDEIGTYEVTKDFLNARSGFESLMKRVNDVIAFMVKGFEEEEEGCSSEGGCSGCSGCGGH
jgi:cell fate (sporulation/competence/biofilm development) regulator YlbF (YheA/YmcA/DUF963 family)